MYYKKDSCISILKSVSKIVLFFGLLLCMCLKMECIVSNAEEINVKAPSLDYVHAEDNTITVTYTWVGSSWYQGEEGDGIEIWRSVNDGEYSLYKTMTKSQAGATTDEYGRYKYADKNLDWNTKYAYSIRTYKNTDSGKVYSEFDDYCWDGGNYTITYKCGSRIPENIEIYATYNSVSIGVPYGNYGTYYNKDTMELSDYYRYYNKISGITGYQIWRMKVGEDTSYKLAKTVKATNYVSLSEDLCFVSDEDLDWGATYKYKVRSYRVDESDSSKIYYSDFVEPSNGDSIVTDNRKVQNLKTVGKKKTITIIWDAIEDKDIEGYEILRATSKTGKYTKIGRISEKNSYTSFEDGKTKNYFVFTDIKISKGQTYYYKIRAYKRVELEDEEKTVFSLRSNPVAGKNNSKYKEKSATEVPDIEVGTASITKAVTAGKGKIKLSWKKVNNVKGYIIYRSERKNGIYKKVKKVNSGSVVSATINAKKGKTFYFKIVAFTKVNGDVFYGNISSIKSVRCSK